MEHKTFELIDVKADGDAGTFTALASVFGNVDRVGDRMLPGSFSKTLDTWRQSGKPLPVILSHNWDDPHKYVGEADPRAVYESDQGLVVQGKMYTDEPLGGKVYELMKRGILTGWSFGYKVPKGGQSKKDGVNDISEVELFEVGPTLVGANPDAQLQEIKSDLGIEEKAEEVDPLTFAAAAQDPKPEDTEPEPIAAEGNTASDDSLRKESREAVRDVIRDGIATVSAEEVKTEILPVFDSLEKTMKEMRNEFEGDMAEMREAIEKLQTDHRNKEPKRAKSPPDPLREESRRVIRESLVDGIERLEKDERPAPEPEIDTRELRKQSRAEVMGVLREGVPSDGIPT